MTPYDTNAPPAGLYPAAYTPVHPDGRLNLSMVDRLADFYAAQGAAGVFVSGSTGEFCSFTSEERVDLAESWVEAAGDRLHVIVQVGNNCQADAVNLAIESARLGARAIATLPPSYLMPSSAREVVEWCVPIAAAAPDRDFYYYDIPKMTGVGFPTSEIMELAAEKIPNFRGVKFSRDDLAELQRCISFSAGRHSIFFGCDENLLAGLSLGVTAAIGSTYNYALPHFGRIIRAFEAGDYETARALQAQVVRMVDALLPYGIIEAGKVIMAELGMDCGPARPPLASLDSRQTDEIRDLVGTLGIHWSGRSEVGVGRIAEGD